MNGKLAYRHALFFATIAFGFQITLAGNGYANCSDRAGDRILLVSTRPAGCSTSLDKLAKKSIGRERVTSGSQTKWIDQDPIAMLGSLDPTLPTIIYVHGNQIDSCGARKRGLDVYRHLTKSACDDRPIQYVIFSWIATKTPGMLRDYREKAARTRPIALQLSWMINRIPSGASVGIIGYSYGSRVASGAAHFLGGGSMNGLRMQENATSHKIRAVFLAAAEDACWLAPTSYHGKAMGCLESLIVTKNPQDPAMRFFRFLSKTSKPDALGGVGPKGLSYEYSQRVQLYNVTRSVGKSHDLYRYLAVSGLMRSSWKRLAFVDQEVATRPTVARMLANEQPIAVVTK